MVTNTDQKSRYFDLTAQSIQLVNQDKRTDRDIEELNYHLQKFKENKPKETIWRKADGFAPYMELPIEIPADMGEVSEYCKPFVGTTFQNIPPDRDWSKQASEVLDRYKGRKFIAEIYEVLYGPWEFRMPAYYIWTIARHRRRKLLGAPAGVILVANHFEKLKPKVSRLVCVGPDLLWHSKVEFVASEINRDLGHYYIHADGEGVGQPEDYVVFYRDA